MISRLFGMAITSALCHFLAHHPLAKCKALRQVSRQKGGSNQSWPFTEGCLIPRAPCRGAGSDERMDIILCSSNFGFYFWWWAMLKKACVLVHHELLPHLGFFYCSDVVPCVAFFAFPVTHTHCFLTIFCSHVFSLHFLLMFAAILITNHPSHPPTQQQQQHQQVPMAL